MDLEEARHFYIGGRWVAPSSGATVAVVDPATETVIGSIAAGTAEDVDKAVAAASKAFATFPATPVEERRALLQRIAGLMESRAEELAFAMTAEMGTAIGFARSSQVPLAIAHLRAMAEVLDGYDFLVRKGTTAIVREPIGVCGLITPWNWPLYQITAKLAPALAAGCTVVLKPSELSPLSALLFAQIMHDAGTPPGVFNLVNGTGEEVGAAIAAHPGIDMVSITGSVRAGVLVAQAAAVTVKRVVQELGGKSPNILLPDADFTRVVPLGITSAFRNVGQSCSAPTRMIVPAGRLAEVEALAGSHAGTLVVGDPRNPRTTLGPIANKAQFDRVQRMIAVGLAEGAKLLCGGRGKPAGLDAGYFVRPTIFSDVTSGMRIAQEEIFGPVLCIIPYETEEEAVAIANDTVFGLGGHVQSSDLDHARRVARQIRSGQVHINHPAWDAHAPFGGYKQSGNGREYGAFGLEECLETKAILGYYPS
ncbi:aldehyde dehydrogenase (NAD+) [Azospirillum lipoferum]|uniref:Aldehyde dehydrogenase family protein n=1 Tax=Azospirillum lipoferum TaxID=193 RepID=A0A5A9GQT7_AZOLI|nr:MULTISPECIES: aldehyde dehydrogenase family protein [Azospirillum]KAA0596145.1 aldehyde dehydrogenase family protein [Azospirillum lipoferum]MCP1611095.1 aldehyde dehydrogenase (NAD+) [Azospirillum lipoferum]MDW5533780.1 aldehyde dehydrogenase family protein [Azospirillum sp. NL1]